MANGQQSSNTQWQHKKQSIKNQQKVKYIEKTEELQWNELKSELKWVNKVNKNINKYKVMIANGLKGSNTQWQHEQQSTDNRQKGKIHEKC